MHFSKILLSMLSSEIGRQFSTLRLSRFLNIGEIAAVFQQLGIFINLLMFLKITCKAFAMLVAVCWKKIGGRPLGPLDLVTSMVIKISVIVV